MTDFVLSPKKMFIIPVMCALLIVLGSSAAWAGQLVKPTGELSMRLEQMSEKASLVSKERLVQESMDSAVGLAGTMIEGGGSIGSSSSSLYLGGGTSNSKGCFLSVQ